jgi:hypothetical protein
MINKKLNISRVSLIVYCVLLVLSGFLACAPGGGMYWFMVMSIFSFTPIFCGSRTYRILGVIALLPAVGLIVSDYYAGKKWKARHHRSAVEINRTIDTNTEKTVRTRLNK